VTATFKSRKNICERRSWQGRDRVVTVSYENNIQTYKRLFVTGFDVNILNGFYKKIILMF